MNSLNDMHQIDDKEMEFRLIYNKYERPALMLREKAQRWTSIMDMLDKDGNELEHEIWWALQEARTEVLDLYEEQVSLAKNMHKACRLGIQVVK